MFDEDRAPRHPAAGPGPVNHAPDRRAARTNLLIRPAKLIGADGEYLCVLRDVSEGGCKVRLFHSLPAAGISQLELGNGDRYAAERVWERDDHAGLRFLEPVPVRHLISEEGRFRKRPVRLRLALPALLVAGRDALPGVLRDLSQQGAQLECAARLAVDQQVRLEVPGLAPIIAKVRWRRETAPGTMGIGLVFEQTFRLDDLARIALRLQQGGTRPMC